MIKIFGLICLLCLVGCQVNTTYATEAPTNCTLTTAAKARVPISPCFSNVQNIIACMPPTEQDLWASANEKNTNTTRCFDCSIVKSALKDTAKSNANAIGKMVTDKVNDKRSAVACFQSFANSYLTDTDKTMISQSFTTLVANQKASGKATAQLLQNVGNVMIGRRRLLCMSTAEIASMTNSKDASGNVNDFKYNDVEVSGIVTNFLNWFETKNTELTSFTNEISTMSDVVANSAKCTLTPSTSTAATTTTSTSVPSSISVDLTSLPSNIAALTPSNIAALTPSNIAALIPSNLAALIPSNLAALIPSNMAALIPSGLSSLIPSNINIADLLNNATSASNFLPSTSGTKPSGSGPAPMGKSVGTDVAAYLINVASVATKIRTTAALDFVTRIQSAFSGTVVLNCQPGGLMKLVSNVANTGSEFTTLLNLLAPGKTFCTSETIYIVTGGKVTCEGLCTGFQSFSLQFNDPNKVPSSYYFAVGCSSSNKFLAGTWSDLTTPTTVYTTFSFFDQNVAFDSDQRCLQKAGGCIPGGSQQGGNVKDGKCAQDMMNNDCKNDLNKKCLQSGLPNVAFTVTSSLPTKCDYAAQNVAKTSESFVTTCFTWIAQTYIKKSMILAPEQLSNDQVIATATATTLRLLTDAIPSIVSTSQDPSYTDKTFETVTLTGTDVQVDGSTALTAGSTTTGVNQVISADATFHKISILVILLVSFLF